jgi:hypothetical protein
MKFDRCDRRLSRAARELLRRHLFESWKETLELTSDTKFHVDVSEWNVWQLLEATLRVPVEGHLAKDMSCPLVPSLDVYFQQETSTLVLDGSAARSIQNAAIPGALHSARKINRKNRAIFHQCGVCQKNFTSHFYLDKHFDNLHSVNKSTMALRDCICPAITYCRFLSPIACFDQAMLLEPFYGPGSDGHGADRHAVQHKLLQLQPICSERIQSAAIMLCHEIVDVCFEGVFGQILGSNMCSRTQSCHVRLLHRMIGSSLMMHPVLWHEALAHGKHGRTLTRIGLTTVALSLVILYGFRLWRTIRGRLIARRSNRKNLLTVNNKAISKRYPISRTTIIGSPSKLKKN